jgi:hypothetical protein
VERFVAGVVVAIRAGGRRRTIVGALQQTILLDRPFPEEPYIAELSRAARWYLSAPPAV